MANKTDRIFKYQVVGFDCDGAGYEETWVQYEGFNRDDAILAKRICEKEGMGGCIRPLTPGPKGWGSALIAQREAFEAKVAQEAEEAYYANL